ncbi:MAG TPA: aminoglycoside phosphotransferase family protein [Thermomicrobiaceae bacterium]|nr:aminoglycoside phosphotransferase family protein [Thermomicrobiaceae bacterium]
MPRDVYLQPGAPDPELTPGVVLALARRHGAAAEAVRAVDESGGEARTYLVDAGGETLVLKVQRPQQLRPRTSLEKEVFFLNQLAELAPDLPVPRVRGYGRDSNEVEYTLMTRMPGVALRRVTLSDQERDAALVALGRLLRRIHVLPQAAFLASGLFPGDYAFPDLQTRIGEAFLDLAARQRQVRHPWPLDVPLEEIGRRVLRALPRTQERAALHSNPYREHVFVDPATHQFTGLIDFGDAYISHPAFDLRRWHRPAERLALRSGYSADAPLSETFEAAWRVVQILADVTLLASYGETDERVAGVPADLALLLSDL